MRDNDNDVLDEHSAPLALLAAYGQRRAARSDNEGWEDRIMELPGFSSSDLIRAHGALLARDWIETRVHASALAIPGQLTACYRISGFGQAVLRLRTS